MAVLTVRNLPESVRLALKARAARNDRSMEAEARAILEATVLERPPFLRDWLEAAESFRGDVELPERSPGRGVELG